jgi:hypothetical protein
MTGKRIVLMCLIMGAAVSSCSTSRSQAPQPSPSSATTQVVATPQSSQPTEPQSQFQFPQKTCGDRPSAQGQDTWYPVFINGGNLENVRSAYCADAIAAVRKTTGVKAVQVGSFTNKTKAEAFARAIGGEVGESTAPVPPIAQATPQTASKTAGSNPEVEMRRQGRLFSQDSGSQINIRDDASTRAYARHIGYSGDPVAVRSKKLGDDSKTWYHVSFNSGAEGWVREEFISFAAERVDSQDTTRSASPSSSIQTAPRSTSSTSSGGSGRCQYPDDLDSRGRRCGKRAASVRPGGN